MKIKLDENLPLRLVRLLATLGHEDYVVATDHKVRVRAPKKQNDPNNG